MERDPSLIKILDPTKTRYRFSDEDLLASLRMFAEQQGNVPFTTGEWDAWPGKRAVSRTFVKRFGTWAETLRRIGITGSKVRAYSPEVCVHFLEECARHFGAAVNSSRCEAS